MHLDTSRHDDSTYCIATPDPLCFDRKSTAILATTYSECLEGYGMVVIFGTRVVEHKLGYVADFCRICRAIRSFHVVNYFWQFHIYRIPLGNTRHAGCRITCMECDTVVSTDPNKYLKVISCEKHEIPDDLVAATFPEIKLSYGSRLELEARIAAQDESIPQSTRTFLIQEPLALVAQIVQEYETRPLSSVWIFLLLVGSITGAFALHGLVGTTGPEYSVLTWTIIGTSLLTTVLAGLFLSTRGTASFADRQIYPPLVKCLRPLKPTREELTNALAALSAKKTPRIRRISADKLIAHLQR